MEFIEIENIEEFEYNGSVYDLTVEGDESYNVNGVIVHNSACTTSANAAVHYPMASLVSECYEISKKFETPTKIIADGGFRNYDDIIKGLAVGANSIMLGGIFNKCLESCSKNYIIEHIGQGYTIYKKQKELTKEEAAKLFNDGFDVFKYFRGMSTKEVQRDWKKDKLTTSEGITKYNKVEYTLSGWTENLIDYLKTTMSYTGCKNLKEFIGEVQCIQISQNSFMRFNK